MAITEERFNEGIEWYLAHGGEEKNLREDIKLRTLANQLGFAVEYGENGGDSLKFTKGNKVIWSCPYVINSGSQNFRIVDRWGCQELINDRWCNNRYYPDLESALRKECI